MIAMPETKTAPMLAALAYCDQLPGRFFPVREGQKTPATSPLTQTDPPVLKKADPANARQLAGKGVKGTVE
jgi:hypothetical protein